MKKGHQYLYASALADQFLMCNWITVRRILHFCSRDSQSFLKLLKTLFAQVNEELAIFCETFTVANSFCVPRVRRQCLLNKTAINLKLFPHHFKLLCVCFFLKRIIHPVVG